VIPGLKIPITREAAQRSSLPFLGLHLSPEPVQAFVLPPQL
jgi:hypothetical protein